MVMLEFKLNLRLSGAMFMKSIGKKILQLGMECLVSWSRLKILRINGSVFTQNNLKHWYGFVAVQGPLADGVKEKMT